MAGLSRLLGIAVSLGLFVIAHSKHYHSPETCTPQATPEPFRHFLVYSAQGIYNPMGEPFPEGCFPGDPLLTLGSCTDTETVFLKKIMNFTEEEIAAEEVKAREFFMERFGLDVEKLSEQGRVSMVPVRVDPRQQYTAFVIGGECVPEEGYEVRDGSFFLTITDPEGVELGGEFEGQMAPATSFMLFGHYNVLIKGPNAREEIIRYKSTMASMPSQGFIILTCELQHPVWGEGLLQGLASTEMLGNGQVQGIIRSVLTFPPLGAP